MQRVDINDYLDIIALYKNGVYLSKGFGAAHAMFGNSFSSIISAKTLI
jgi:hypothetical protein